MSHFIPLAARSFFDLDGGPRSPDDWCRRAAALGYSALGIIERGPFASLPDFLRAAREHRITPVFGVEMSLTLPLPDNEPARKGSKAEPESAQAELQTQPVLLYAQSAEGLRSLFQLCRAAFSGWPKDERPLSWEELAARSGGVVVVVLPSKQERTTPLGGMQPKQLSRVGADLHELFGGFAFMGLPAPDAGDDTFTRQAQAAANYMGLPSVALPELRHIERDDRKLDAALTAARRKLGTAAAPYSSGGGASALFLPPEEYDALYSEWQDALSCSAQIAELCRGVDPLSLFESGNLEVDNSDVIARIAPAARKVGAPVIVTPSSAVTGAEDESPGSEAVRSQLASQGTEIQVGRSGLSRLLVELGRDETIVYPACYLEMPPAVALSAAFEVLRATANGEVSPHEPMTWAQVEVSAQSHSPELAALAGSLQGIPVRFNRDHDCIYISRSDNISSLPLLRRDGDGETWLPWLSRDLNSFGLAPVPFVWSREITTLERAAELAASHITFSVALTDDPIPSIGLDAALPLLTDPEAARGIPFWNSELAAKLKKELSQETTGETLHASLLILMAESGLSQGEGDVAERVRLCIWGALIKAYTPAATLAALFDDAYTYGELAQIARLKTEAKRLSVNVQPPDASTSDAPATLVSAEGGVQIKIGLSALPGWSEHIASRFIARRNEQAPDSLGNLRTMLRGSGATPAQVSALVRSGACDTFGGQARHRVAALRFLLGGDGEGVDGPLSEEATHLSGRLTTRELVTFRSWEEEILGFGITDTSVISKMADAVNKSPSVAARLANISSLGDEQLGSSVLFVGLLRDILRLEASASIEGPPLATALLEDASGSIELLAFPPNFERHQEMWQEDMPLIVTARVQRHADGELYLLCEHLAHLTTAEEEAELDVRVSQKGARKTAKSAFAETEVLAKPGSSPSNGHAAHAASQNGPAVHPAQPRHENQSRPEQPDGTGDTSLARYRVVISMPDAVDDHEAIDAMIAVNAVLTDHPGHDIVTVRIPYLGGTRHVATAQVPRTISFSERVKERLERLLSPQALVIIELAAAG
jgi:hypothetical protein